MIGSSQGLAAIVMCGLVLLPLMIGIAVRLIYGKQGRVPDSLPPAEQPLIRLNQRLANGDITEEEYLRIKSLLAESLYAEKAKRDASVRLSDDGELIEGNGGEEPAQMRIDRQVH